MRHVLKELSSDNAQLPGRPLLHVAFGTRSPAVLSTAPAWQSLSGKQLDATQTAAVDLVLAAQDLALIHGPPGACWLAAGLMVYVIVFCSAIDVLPDGRHLLVYRQWCSWRAEGACLSCIRPV
jgi:hypothetical protein